MLRLMNALFDIVDTQLQLTDEPADELPYDDETFEIVVANNAVSRSADAHAALAEIARVLKPGGKLALYDSVRRGPASGDAPPPRLFGYLHAVTANGFTVDSCRSYGGPCLTLVASKPE
jgi:ubiquinone/menaquinone biosynthesis C-methylase UbiE